MTRNSERVPKWENFLHVRMYIIIFLIKPDISTHLHHHSPARQTESSRYNYHKWLFIILDFVLYLYTFKWPWVKKQLLLPDFVVEPLPVLFHLQSCYLVQDLRFVEADQVMDDDVGSPEVVDHVSPNIDLPRGPVCWTIEYHPGLRPHQLVSPSQTYLLEKLTYLKLDWPTTHPPQGLIKFFLRCIQDLRCSIYLQ